MNHPLSLVLAGGGTGGHIYPGLAVAEKILRFSPQSKVYFVGSEKGLETKIVPPKNIDLFLLPVAGLNRVGVFQTIKSLLVLPLAFIKSLILVLKLKPDFVLGLGGYASGPFVLAAALLGKKTALWEINAIPGWTNRILSRFVGECWVVFQEAKPYLKNKRTFLVGIPVREIIQPNSSHTGGKFKILVFGGSQGARGINYCIRDLINKNPDWFRQIELRWQTGYTDYEQLIKVVNKPSNVEIKKYLDNIEQDYNWADLVICRAGASTLAELSAAQKAAVLVPFPYAADNHQQKNAQSFVEKNAARMLLQENLTPESLSAVILEFMNDQQKIKVLEQSVSLFHTPEASSKLAKMILDQ